MSPHTVQKTEATLVNFQMPPIKLTTAEMTAIILDNLNTFELNLLLANFDLHTSFSMWMLRKLDSQEALSAFITDKLQSYGTSCTTTFDPIVFVVKLTDLRDAGPITKSTVTEVFDIVHNHIKSIFK